MGPSERRPIAAVFCAAFGLCAMFTKTDVLSWNDGSRFATVDALTASGTFQIDESPYAVRLGDKISYRGRTYSDKPPLLALEGAAVAAAVAPLGVSLRRTPALAIYLVTLFTVGVWFAIGCSYAFAFARFLGFARRTAVAAAALTGAGTLCLTYATVFTNHVPAGAASLAACYHLVRCRGRRGCHDLAAGLFFGLAYAFDASTSLIALAAGPVLLWGERPWRWLASAAAGAPIVALQFAYNLAISGSVVPTVFNASAWSGPHLPPHSWWSQIVHVYTLWEYLVFATNLTIGSKGFFAFTPLMLVAGYGIAQIWRTPGVPRRLAQAIVMATAVYFLAILFLQNDSGSRNFGERRYVDLMFLLGLGFAPALTSIRSAFGRNAVRVVAGLSVAIAVLGTAAPFGGVAGESGFLFAGAAFAALFHRAPLQAGADVVLLAALVAFVVWLTAQGQAPEAASRPRLPFPS